MNNCHQENTFGKTIADMNLLYSMPKASKNPRYARQLQLKIH